MRAVKATIQNCFLRALTDADFALLSPHLTQVDLPRRMKLIEEQKVIDHVYFPESGLASIVALTPEREMSEVGAFGYEGSSNFVLNPGEDRVPLRTFMQISGAGWRIDAKPFAEALRGSVTFMSAVMRYEQYKATQFAYTSLSIGSYTIPERLARWILMTQDRVGDTFPITHEYLAMMLAVRRSGVTEGLQKLEGELFIKARRGNLSVTNREGLLEFAGGSYGVPEALYERVIGPLQLRPDGVCIVSDRGQRSPG
jgi:CRP-like cAMP-binding protein